MPIIIVGEEVLEKRLECIVNPIKGDELYLYLGIEGKIMEKAGQEELIKLFDRANPYEAVCPFVTSGLKLSDKIIHIIATEMSQSLDFKHDMYYAYDRVIRKAMEEKVSKLVFPSIPYAYKRKGRMNTYRTSMALLRHFTRWYNPNFTVYLLVDKAGIKDHVDNYVPDYIPSSLPLSRRHKPLDYPFLTTLEAKTYFLKNFIETTKHEDLVVNRDYEFDKIDEKFEEIYNIARTRFKDHATFCNEANISMDRFIKIFKGELTPNKEELLAMCLAVKFDIRTTVLTLRNSGYNMSLSNLADKAIIDFINNEKYDVYEINEYLFVNNLPQLGSITSCEVVCENDFSLI